MVERAEELARVERRMADVRHAIEEARHRRGWSAGVGQQARILSLLAATLKALEARKAALQSANQ
jgi:uncharacterized protein with von Willebrand factor type A (vWA) domain